MDGVKWTVYKWVCAASIATALAGFTILWIATQLGAQFEPYKGLLHWMAAVQISIFVCTLCFTFWIVAREACSQFYFAMGLLAFAMLNLLLGTTGILIFYVNDDTEYQTSTTTYDDHYTRVGYVIGSLVAVVLLFGVGILGLCLFNLSQENYYEDSRRRFECCFKMGTALLDDQEEPDNQKTQKDGESTAAEQILTESQPILGEEEHQLEVDMVSQEQTTISRIVQLQQHQFVVDGSEEAEEIHFWRLSQLTELLEVSIQELERSTIMCSEKSRGVHILKKSGKRSRLYPAVVLLPRAWLRSEEWVKNLWGTALALAFIESQLPPDTAAAKSQERIQFNLLLGENHPAQEHKRAMERQREAETSQGDDPLAGLHGGHDQDTAGLMSLWEWFQPTLWAVEYICYTLQAAKTHREVKSTPIEWVNQAREYIYYLSLIHISEPTRLLSISYAVFCLKKKKKKILKRNYTCIIIYTLTNRI
eukprot:TRINITY_DN8951_c0_g1_i3.p1 TRINITY_DN8951_c0_g1~~TRINITY_DN8951_c0_g1_i3.p1  ORF type:complete len:477 (-),score=112.25 TRINITY_DN8951_c0_g1_i3:6-1436(-)